MLIMFWRPAGYQPLHKKSAGLSLHISNYLIKVDSWLKFKQDEVYVIMKSDANCNG